MTVFERELLSPEQTSELGRSLGTVVIGGDVIGLTGDLGAGKTHFVQGLAVGLGVPASQRVTSPTFTLVNEYDGGRSKLLHADLYRLETQVELDQIGLVDACYGDDVVAVEWARNVPGLPGDLLLLDMAVVGPTSRRMTATGHGPRSDALLQRWMTAAGNLTGS